MKVEQINATDYANIYGIYEDNGKPVGTAEVKIAGWEAGKVYCYSLCGKYSKADIRKIFKGERK